MMHATTIRTSRSAWAFRCKMTRPQAGLKQTCFFLTSALRCAVDFERKSSHVIKLWDPVQLMQVVIDTINRRVRRDIHFFETYVRCFRSIGKSANIDCQKFVHFFIRRVFFRFSKTFIPFASCFRTKFQRYNKNNYMILLFTGDPKFR